MTRNAFWAVSVVFRKRPGTRNTNTPSPAVLVLHSFQPISSRVTIWVSKEAASCSMSPRSPSPTNPARIRTSPKSGSSTAPATLGSTSSSSLRRARSAAPSISPSSIRFSPKSSSSSTAVTNSPPPSPRPTQTRISLKTQELYALVFLTRYLHFASNTTVFGVFTESMQLSYDSRGNSVPTILLPMQGRLYAEGGLQAKISSIKLDMYRKFSNALAMTVIASLTWIAYELKVATCADELIGSWARKDSLTTYCYLICLGFLTLQATLDFLDIERHGSRLLYASKAFRTTLKFCM